MPNLIFFIKIKSSIASHMVSHTPPPSIDSYDEAKIDNEPRPPSFIAKVSYLSVGSQLTVSVSLHAAKTVGERDSDMREEKLLFVFPFVLLLWGETCGAVVRDITV